MRQFHLAILAKGVTHAALLLALDAFNFNVGNLAGRPKFIKPQFIAAVGLPAMHELYPGEIVQVASRAGDQEPSGNSSGRFALLSANPVDVPAAILPIEVQLQLEQAGLDRGQQPAVRTEKPARERSDRDADIGRLVERAGLETS